jgi:hypothetical protein
MVQIGAETPLCHAGVQRRLRGRHHLDIDGVLAHRPHPPHTLGLNRRQELALQRQRQRVDLVQEQGAPGGRFE